MAHKMPTTTVPTFGVGDRVYDREHLLDTSREPTLAVVTEALDTTAATTHIDPTRTVAAVNEAYPADDLVYRVVFTSGLAGLVGERWQAWEGETFTDDLRGYCQEWGLPTPTMYSYPASRLVPKGEF